MMSVQRERFDSTIDPFAIKEVVLQDNVAALKIPGLHTSDVSAYGEFRTRDTLDIFDGAVGRQ